MELEDRIRSQIEAILVNDARNFNEIKSMAAEDEPFEGDVLDDERNLYHRIINGYRNAVSEVNKLLEQNIGSLSGFYRIVESIKEKKDFQEICSQIVDCILQDFGAEYCSLLFPEKSKEEILYLEGINEERRFLRIHSNTSLLANREFEDTLTRMADEDGECVKIDDVYKESQFNEVDFPSVVRSVLCLPIQLHGRSAGFFILSHSLPKFFHEDHIRLLKILCSLIAHLKLLHLGSDEPSRLPSLHANSEDEEPPDAYSIVLLSFETQDAYGRRFSLDKPSIGEIRMRLQNALEGKESVLFYREKELIVLMPNISSEELPKRVRCLREAFHNWKLDRAKEHANARVNLGFSVCEGDQDLSRTLEIASLVMQPESEEDQ
jgi:hypothetical protein